jgi:hypothetical protein
MFLLPSDSKEKKNGSLEIERPHGTPNQILLALTNRFAHLSRGFILLVWQFFQC